MGEGDRSDIFGISLEKPGKYRPSAGDRIPDEVTAWLDGKLELTAANKPFEAISDDILQNGTAYLAGYIKGYDTRAGFSTGLIYMDNFITREEYPVVVEIYPDGRFEAEILLIHPVRKSITFDRQWIPPVYMEQGQTLVIILDWQDFLEADRLRNTTAKFSNTRFMGPLAKINEELVAFEPKSIPPQERWESYKSQTLEELKRRAKSILDENITEIDSLQNAGKISSKAASILKGGAYVDYGYYLMDYDMVASFEQQNTPRIQPLKIEDFGFLREMPLDDPALIISDGYDSFLNRFEFASIFTGRYAIGNEQSSFVPEKKFEEYLTGDIGIELSAEALAASEKMEMMTQAGITSANEIYNNITSEYMKFFAEYLEKYGEPYVEKNIEPFIPSRADKLIKAEMYRDSIASAILGPGPGMLKILPMIRSLSLDLKSTGKEGGKKLMAYALKPVSNSFIRAEAARIYDEQFPEGKKTAYTLPDGKGSEIFRKIIDNFKGKLLIVDFWATTCGPCIANIERTKQEREEYAGSPDIEFVFITSDRESPEQAYVKFVEEQQLRNTYRLTQDEYNYLRQLFKFNGIPHYVLVDRNGDILDDNYQYYSIKAEVEKYK